MTITCKKLLDSFAKTSLRLTDVIFPPLCPLCRLTEGGREKSKTNYRPDPDNTKQNLIAENGLCFSCRKSITDLTAPMCYVCGEPFNNMNSQGRSSSHCGECLKNKPQYSLARSGFAYDGKLQHAIHHFKYNGQTILAPMLASLAAPTLNNLVETTSDNTAAGRGLARFDTIVPVPLHKNRLRKRGFNQSLLLVRELLRQSLRLGRPRLDHLNLQRIKDTRSQIELTGKQRAENVKNAFTIKNATTFKGKKVLLVDDVYTTGATIRECSKVLANSGAEVFALTLARVVRV
jgi:ComF family protein